VELWRLDRGLFRYGFVSDEAGVTGRLSDFWYRKACGESIIGGSAVTVMAGTTSLGHLANAIEVRNEAQAGEAAIVAELRAGSEEAYAWLIREFHQPIYSLVYRMVSDPSDAADTTQEVFLKVFRGIGHFHGKSSLKTWIYRIALHEASNRRRWWFRHKAKETSIEPNLESCADESGYAPPLKELMDSADSPFENAAHEEVRERVEVELRQIPEPYRTTVILRDIEEMSYEEVAEITEVSLGTVKSRLTRGREALRQRLTEYVRQSGRELGLNPPSENKAHKAKQTKPAVASRLSAKPGMEVAS
jgi:RNA polymerase sigma-70 factor, ECF subfamily